MICAGIDKTKQQLALEQLKFLGATQRNTENFAELGQCCIFNHCPGLNKMAFFCLKVNQKPLRNKAMRF